MLLKKRKVVELAKGSEHADACMRAMFELEPERLVAWRKFASPTVGAVVVIKDALGNAAINLATGRPKTATITNWESYCRERGVPLDYKGSKIASLADTGVIYKIENLLSKDTQELNQQPLKKDWEFIAKILKANNIENFYHFTDKENLLSILEAKGLYSWGFCEKNGINIKAPGGGDLSKHLDSRKNLENYVRLSFVKNHPMAFVAKKEGRIKEPIVLIIDIQVLFWEKTLFSNGNAAQNEVGLSTNVEDLQKIQFAIFKKDYHSLSTKQEKQAYQSEILVFEHIPLQYIKGYFYL